MLDPSIWPKSNEPAFETEARDDTTRSFSNDGWTSETLCDVWLEARIGLARRAPKISNTPAVRAIRYNQTFIADRASSVADQCCCPGTDRPKCHWRCRHS